jgi:hypothetical protein
VRPAIVSVGTSLRPSRLAASSRAWPARMVRVSSIRIGLVQTRSMLCISPAIWSSGWRRGFPGKGFRSPIATQVILSLSPRGALVPSARLGVAAGGDAAGDCGAICRRVPRPESAESVRCFMPAIIGSREAGSIYKITRPACARADARIRDAGRRIPAWRNTPVHRAIPYGHVAALGG